MPATTKRFVMPAKSYDLGYCSLEAEPPELQLRAQGPAAEIVRYPDNSAAEVVSGSESLTRPLSDAVKQGLTQVQRSTPSSKASSSSPRRSRLSRGSLVAAGVLTHLEVGVGPPPYAVACAYPQRLREVGVRGTSGWLCITRCSEAESRYFGAGAEA